MLNRPCFAAFLPEAWTNFRGHLDLRHYGPEQRRQSADESNDSIRLEPVARWVFGLTP